MGASANSTRRPAIPRTHHQNIDVCVPFWNSSPTQNYIDVSNVCCISYNLQPHCTDNRHIHARIQKWRMVSSLYIRDVTHGKTVKTILYEDKELDILPQRLLPCTGLQSCNVAGLHNDLIVVQVFCQEAIKFFVCSLNDESCKLVFNRKYSARNKLQLYECHISQDENFMLIVQNQIYSTMYCTGSEVEEVSLLQINWDTHTCKEMSCENLNEQMQLAHYKTAVVFDPRTDNDLVLFSSCSDDRGIISLYKTRKDNFLFKIIEFKKDCPALPGECQNLQFLSDGSALVLSVLGTEVHPRSIASVCRLQIVTVYWFNPDCYDKLGSFWYVSPTSYIQYIPMIAASGRYACCGGKIYNLDDMHPYFHGTKSLMRICKNVIVDTVLAEDIPKLPLPNPLLRYLSKCDPDINHNL